MSERTARIRPETHDWLVNQYEREVLVFVNNPEDFCESEREDEHPLEIMLQYQILVAVGQDINYSFWAVVESMVDADDPKSMERVNRLRSLVLPGERANA